MRETPKTLLGIAWMVLTAVVLAAGSGCVAFNVGKPEVSRKTTAVKSETVSTPISVVVEAATGELKQKGNSAVASIHAKVREKYKKRVWEVTTTTRSQKRLAIGLFPGAAEICGMPDGALLWDQSLGDYGGMTAVLNVGFLGTPTACSLVVAPFVPWECTHKRRRGQAPFRNGGTAGYDVGGGALGGMLLHCGLLGWHKHLAVFEESTDGPKRMEEVLQERQLDLGGLYGVEFRIPALDHVQMRYVRRGETNAVFDLPQVENGGRYEATAMFCGAGTGTPGLVEQALAKMEERTVRTEVWLPEKPKAVQPPSAAEPQIVREVVVREIHHYHEAEKKPEGPPYTVEKTRDGAGRTVWKVKMREDQTAFGVDREVHAQLLQELRDDFAGRNPNVPRGEINAWATYTTEDGGRTLVYEGEASSFIPKLESLRYDAKARRGEVTMRLAAGADLRKSKEFVRRNISAIVCDKNVVLTGERPPDGARYRSLDENFADGVLTVEFEAVE